MRVVRTRIILKKVILNEGYLNIPTYKEVLNIDPQELRFSARELDLILTLNKPKL